MNGNQVMLPFEPLSTEVPLASMLELIEESHEACAHCGETSTLSPHRMDRSKVGVLEALADMLVHGCSWTRVETGSVVVGHETGSVLVGQLENGEERRRVTPYRADQHATRLTWFGLVEHEKPRSARYRMTQKGWDFLHGRTVVPAKILCRQGAVVFSSVERLRIDQVRGVVLDRDYWDRYPWAEWEGYIDPRA